VAELDRAAIERTLAAGYQPAMHFMHPAEVDMWEHYYATGVWDETRRRVLNPDTLTWERTDG
jgi:hypothetical protein